MKQFLQHLMLLEEEGNYIPYRTAASNESRVTTLSHSVTASAHLEIQSPINKV